MLFPIVPNTDVTQVNHFVTPFLPKDADFIWINFENNESIKINSSLLSWSLEHMKFQRKSLI